MADKYSTARLRATVAEWLKACNLEPTWGAVDLIEYHERAEQEASK